MSLSVGIIGLPNVGKSTLFNAILGRQQALTAPYPFATIEPNVGVVDVPDHRLVVLHNTLANNPRSDVTPKTPIVYSTVTFVDIAGLVKGAAEGQGLGNKFLSHIRDVDVILHVVRDFDDPDVPRAPDSKDPENDAEIVEMELALKDMEIAERAGKAARAESSKAPVASPPSLVQKPTLFVTNVNEEKIRTLEGSKATVRGKKSLFMCAKIEEQISQLSKNEQKEYLTMYGLERSSLDRIITECFSLLGLIPFFTAGKIEVRAWPVKKGSTASNAAGKIHSDFEKLFIRAEIIDWQKLTEAGSWQDAKEKGLVRTEGRDYVVQDGEVCNFLIGK